MSILQAGLISSWCFDQTEGPLAPNTVPGAAPLEISGCVFERRRFGGALVLRRPNDFARGPAPGVLRAGAISFWFRLDDVPSGAELINVQGDLSIFIDASPGTGLVAQLGDRIMPSGQQIEPGSWQHVVLAFSPDGTTLYLDGRAVTCDPKANTGLKMGRCRDEFLAIGTRGSTFTPFAIDDLALFDHCLDQPQVTRLALDDYGPAAHVEQADLPRTIEAQDYLDLADPTCGFQAAIDATGAAGGVVTLPPGRYSIKRPLVLHSRVTLCGARGQTILVAPPPGASALASHAVAGAPAVRVEDVADFACQSAVTICSEVSHTWQATMALIESIDASTLSLSRPLCSAYMTFDGAMAVTWFPMILATRRHEVHVIDLVIEGTPQAPADSAPRRDLVLRSCPAIQLLECVNASVRRCRVEGWPHDGIGIHGGTAIQVDACAASHCRGHGFFADEPARSTQWRGNRAEHNQMDGLFLGADVRDSIVAHNLLNHNSGHGIGGRDQGNNTTNLISANQCLENRLGGIERDGS